MFFTYVKNNISTYEVKIKIITPNKHNKNAGMVFVVAFDIFT